MNAQIKNKVVEEVSRFSTDLNSARYKVRKESFREGRVDLVCRFYMKDLMDTLETKEDEVIRNFIYRLYQILDEADT